jgi:hypothetical protein
MAITFLPRRVLSATRPSSVFVINLALWQMD